MRKINLVIFDTEATSIFIEDTVVKDEINQGVPVVAQWVKNPTSIHENVGSTPGLAQWFKDPVLPHALV